MIDERKYLTEKERDAFFAAVKRQRKTARRRRDLCLFRLMYSFGLRLAEVTLIRLADINWESGQIFIRRLKRNRRGTPREGRFGQWHKLSVENQRLLRDWLKERARLPYAAEVAEVFISSRGRHLDDQTIYYLFKQYAKAAGLDARPEPAHPHNLRHTVAMDLAREGVPIQDIQDRLGHAAIQSTQIYTEMFDAERIARDMRLDEILEGRR
jgi:integrase/recombinase XerC